MRRRSPVPIIVAAVAVGAVLVAALVIRLNADDDGLPPDIGVVDHVVDGDTIDIVIGGREERVRLIGINTPEIAHDDEPAECFGPEAAAFTSEQLPEGTQVRLERDVVGRDDYGRLLAYVYRRHDDVFLNEVIVAAGLARPLTIPPNDTFAGRFIAAATAADAAGTGLWAACAG
ncbi:thermonuclease family protein [Desertimonas flava]|uniref:thermonuclease family protein n=1 Tax=Desertimonas flava TaxID=2064846 RepID=UPI000E34B7BF|nr:thermonuclease family protein [Desertimonas flava]